jgi:hypothetical protein
LKAVFVLKNNTPWCHSQLQWWHYRFLYTGDLWRAVRRLRVWNGAGICVESEAWINTFLKRKNHPAFERDGGFHVAEVAQQIYCRSLLG